MSYYSLTKFSKALLAEKPKVQRLVLFVKVSSGVKNIYGSINFRPALFMLQSKKDKEILSYQNIGDIINDNQFMLCFKVPKKYDQEFIVVDLDLTHIIEKEGMDYYQHTLLTPSEKTADEARKYQIQLEKYLEENRLVPFSMSTFEF